MTADDGVVTRVLTLANELHMLAKRYGRDDLADVLATEAGRWGDRVTTIVVAGAQKRGKSRLLNAVLEQPELLPVDVDIATDTYLSMRRGPELSVTVRRRVAGTETSAVVRPDDIRDYASALGDPAKRLDVVGVDLTIDRPVLDGLRLIDTPGVDSLTIGHRHTTMALLPDADALLFTLSAQDQPVLRHELEFLAEAARRVHAIAFVLTKIEDSPSWRDLLAENRERLAAFVALAAADADPRDADRYRALLSAPWLPVSAKLAEAASVRRAAGAADRADELWRRSGMDALADHLRACAAGRELARCGRVLSGCRGVVRALAGAEQDRLIAATTGADTLDARLAAVDAALHELTEKGRDRRRFAIEQQFLGREIGTLVRSRLEEIKRPYDQTVGTLTSRAKVDQFLADLPVSMERSLEAAWAELVGEVQTRVDTALGGYLAGMGLDPVDVDLATITMPKAVGDRLTSRPAPTAHRFDMLREGVPGLTMAASLAGMLAAIPGMLPIAFVVGPLIAYGVTHRRHQWEVAGRNQAGLRQAVAEVLGAAGADMSTALEQAIARWRGDVEHIVDEALARQQREMERHRAELTALSARDAATRKQTADVANERLAALARIGEQAGMLDAEVTVAIAAMTR
jgi:hypothetical protein